MKGRAQESLYGCEARGIPVKNNLIALPERVALFVVVEE